jgi:hypothetical protein
MRVWLLVLAVAGAVLAAGCGGEDAPEETPEAEPAPQVAYLEALGQALDPVLEASGGLPDVSALEELEAALAELETAARKADARLRGADPPRDLAGAHERLVSGLEVLADGAAEAQEALAAAREGDLDELPSLLELGSALGLDGFDVIRDALAELRELGVEIERIGER